MTTFSRTMRSEWTKFRTSRSMMWTAVVMAISIPLFAVFVAATGTLQDDDTILGGSLTGAVNAQLIAGVVGGLVMTSEYRTGSIRQSLAAVPRRRVLLAAKAVVVASVVFTFTVVAAVAAFVIGSAMLDHDRYATGEPFPALLGVAAIITVMSLVGLAIGTLVRHSAGTVAAVIAALLLPSIVGPLLGDLQRWLGGSSPTGVLEKFTQTSDATHETVGSLGSWPSLVLVSSGAVVLVSAAARAFQRRDA